MLYTIAVLANVLFFLTFGSLYYRRKIEAIQDPKKRAEYTRSCRASSGRF